MLNNSHMKATIKWSFLGILFAAMVINPTGFWQVVSLFIGVISPLLLGMAVAFIVNIPLRMLEAHLFRDRGRISHALQCIKRPACMLLSFALVIAVATAIIWTIVPRIGGAVTEAAEQLTAWIRYLIDNYRDKMPELVAWIETLNIDITDIQQNAMQFLQNGLGTFINGVTRATTSVFGLVPNLVLTVIFAINLLAQKEKWQHEAEALLRAYTKPARADHIINALAVAKRIFTAFVSGQITEAFILAALCYLGMRIFNFPLPLLISAIVFIGALIPIFGALASTILGGLFVLIKSPLASLEFVIFFNILQQLESNLIYPRVVGTRVGLPVVWLLAAITLGGGIAGINGMLLSVPTAATIYHLLRSAVAHRNGRPDADDLWLPQIKL